MPLGAASPIPTRSATAPPREARCHCPGVLSMRITSSDSQSAASGRQASSRPTASPSGTGFDTPAPDSLRLVQVDKPVVALGLTVSYLMTKPAFASVRFGAWSRILVGQINRGHYRLAIDAKDEIQGFMGWALSSRERAEDWVQGRHALAYDECLGGDCAILNAWAANTGEVNRFMRVEGRKMLATYQVKMI